MNDFDMSIGYYTSNLKEKVRIDIGKILIGHEVYKLFPELDYKSLKAQIDNLWTDFSNIVAVRDFWNLVDSLMMGYKLKDIVRLVTSSQIDWNLTTLKINNLRFTSDILIIDGFDITKKTAREVSSYLNEHSEVFAGVKVKNHETNPGLNDPVLVEKQTDGTLHVHDGNGRLLKVIIQEKDSIIAYVGTHNRNVSKSNHWVPTSYLMRLYDERQKDLLIKLLQQSDNAIFEFENRVYPEEGFKQEVLNALNTSL